VKGQRCGIVHRELEFVQMVLLGRDVHGILVGDRITCLDSCEIFVVHGDPVEVNIVRPAVGVEPIRIRGHRRLAERGLAVREQCVHAYAGHVRLRKQRHQIRVAVSKGVSPVVLDPMLRVRQE